MAKSVKRNYIYNVIYEVFILIIPFAITPYLSRVLGADGIGEYSFVASIVSYFILFAVLGITTYGQREVSFVQNDKEKRSEVFWNTKIFQVITSCCALLIYVVFSLFQSNKAFFLIFVFNILAVTADVTWFFRGMEEFGRIVLRNVLLKILNFMYIFVFVKGPSDLHAYAFGMCFFEFIANVSLWVYLPKFINKPRLKNIKPFTNFTVILSLFVPTIAIQIYTVLDKTMIGLITYDAFENGYYEQAIRVSKMALTFVTALGAVMIPRIGFLFSNGESERVKQYMYRGYRFVWFLGTPLCFGLIGISDNFVPWFYGDGFDKVSTLLKILSFLILAIGVSNVTGMQYLIPTKRQSQFTRSVVIGAVTNFCLNLILIYFFKSIGAAIASLIAEVVISVVQLFYVRNELSFVKIIKSSLRYLVSGSVMLIVLRILNYYFPPKIIYSAIMIVVGCAVYCLCLLMMRDYFFVDNCKMILSKFRRSSK